MSKSRVCTYREQRKAHYGLGEIWVGSVLEKIQYNLCIRFFESLEVFIMGGLH